MVVSMITCAHKFCDEKFIPKHYKAKYCHKDHYSICENCGKNFVVSRKMLSRLPRTCSSSCASSLGHTEKSKEKRRENSQQKYGVDNPFQSIIIKEKTKKTLDNNQIVKSLSSDEKKMINDRFSFDFLSEWDFEKNSIYYPNLDIRNVKPRSNRKFWWLCCLGHSYETSTRNKSTDCLVCTNRRLLTGFNDFATKNPQLLNAWLKYPENPDPTTIIFNNSTIKVKMYCEEGHSYIITPHELSRGSKCPYCYGTKILQGFNDLATKCPDSVIWWDYSKNSKGPKEVKYGSQQKMWWICEKGHSYEAAIHKFYIGQRCPTCIGKKIDNNNNLAIKYPFIAEEWNYSKNTITPNDITPGHDAKVWWVCKKCNNEWQAYVYNRTNKNRPQMCPKCAKGQTSSRAEKELFTFLQDNTSLDLIPHSRIKNSNNNEYELDILIPEKNIAIEYNGVYYHSEKFVDKNYHYSKFLTCKNNNIQLIQIWEDDWNNKQDIIKKMLLHKLEYNHDKIYARKTSVQKITLLEANVFLQRNHIQGGTNSSLNFGLFYQNNIVAVLAIRQEDNKKTGNIVRYATNVNVVGGFTKILSYIKKNYNFDKFITFSDNNISNGGLYEKNGFIVDRMLPPDYSYLVNNKREHKFKYRKNKFKNDPKLIYDASMTERELAQLNNLERVYDSGKIKWVYYID